MRILNVCLGNICRSPMAEGILSHLATERNLPWEIDSAGTGSWHIGEQPDRRAIQTCRQRGIDITYQRARQITQRDFEYFDLILAMDESNLQNILTLNSTSQPSNGVHLITEFASVTAPEVPDPYFDGSFQEVFDLLWDCCNRIIEKHPVK